MSQSKAYAIEAQKKTAPARHPEPEATRQSEQGPVQQVAPQAAYRRAQVNRSGLRPGDLLALQRTVGNQQVQHILAGCSGRISDLHQNTHSTPKAQIGAPTKPSVDAPSQSYKQETDSLIKQAMQMPESASTGRNTSSASKASSIQQAYAQRIEEQHYQLPEQLEENKIIQAAFNSQVFVQRVPKKVNSVKAEVGSTKKVSSPVHWAIDHKNQRALAIPKPSVNLDDIAQFLYGTRSATADLASINKIDRTRLLGRRPLRLTGQILTKTAFSDLQTSPKVPIGVTNPETFLARKAVLDKELEKDFTFIVSKLDEIHYSDSDEQAVITILKKWSEEKLTSNPQLYPKGGEYLDRLFSKLSMKTKDVGVITTQRTSYYSLIFNHFDRADEVKSIRDRYSRQFKGDSGQAELSFGSFFWEQVKEGKIRDQIFAYLAGMAEAGIGVLQGIELLLNHPEKVIEGIGKLPSTVKVLWKNKEAIWNEFLNAPPEKQARVIGRLFGEAELLILTSGAGASGKAATSAPQVATAVQVVGVSGGAAVLSSGGAITINLGQSGVEAARLTVLMSKTFEASVKGKEKAEAEAKAPGGEQGILFTKEMHARSEVIATGKAIRKVAELVEKFGGKANNWVKKKTWDTSGREIHYYEHPGIGRRGVKFAGELDPF